MFKIEISRFLLSVCVFCLILKTECAYVKTQRHNNNNSNRSMSEMIKHDMELAFKMVTNSTYALKHTIPEMYASSLLQPDPVIRFQLPLAIPDKPTSNALVSMQRNSFMEPIFPNLTSEYMTLAMQKRRHQHKPLVTDAVVLKDADNVNSAIDDYDDDNDWYILGLPGWHGEISEPVAQLEMSHKEPSKPNKQKPISNPVQSEINASYNNNTNTPAGLSTENSTNMDVYIARANDPFGYSTKWQRKNFTNFNIKNDTKSDERSKRDLIKLYSMIKCSTGCDPLAYKGYGCYCGFSGAGVPVDGIDRCCKVHDKCYENSNCISYLEYFVPYIWKCYRGKPLCAIDHGEWGGPQSCAARLCYCDLRLSRCLRQFVCPQERAVCRSSFTRRLQNFLLFK